MTHILINMVHKKVEQQYEELGKAINKAASQRDLATFEEYMGIKMCFDAHLAGKNVLSGFRSLFTFTASLFIVMNNSDEFLNRKNQWAEIFEDIDVFQSKMIQLPTTDT